MKGLNTFNQLFVIYLRNVTKFVDFNLSRLIPDLMVRQGAALSRVLDTHVICFLLVSLVSLAIS